MEVRGMLTQEKRMRLGEIKSRIDLTVEEDEEMQNLMQQVRGNADFYADYQNHILAANTASAKKRLPINFTSHDPAPFIGMVETIMREGFTVQERRYQFGRFCASTNR